MNVAQLGGPIVGGLLLEAGFGLAGIDHAGCVFKLGCFPPRWLHVSFCHLWRLANAPRRLCILPHDQPWTGEDTRGRCLIDWTGDSSRKGPNCGPSYPSEFCALNIVLNQDEEDIDCDDRLSSKHRKKKNKVKLSSRNWCSCLCVCATICRCVVRCLSVGCSPSRRFGSALPPSSSPLPAMVSSLSTWSLRFSPEKICSSNSIQVLRNFNLTPFYIGIFFGLRDGANSLASPIWGWICDRWFK